MTTPTTPDITTALTDPNSALSKRFRLACWITGSTTRRSPTTAAAFLKMAKERRDVEKAREEWAKRKKAALDAHVEQWGHAGLLGAIDDTFGNGPQPTGTALLKWYRENGRGAGETSSGGGSSEGHETVVFE